MKKLISILLCFILLILSIIFCSAATPYGNVSEDTSQIKILIEAMLNTPGFDLVESDWFAFRSELNRYDLYFNIDYEDYICNRYSYIGTQNQQYGTNWQLTYTEDVPVPDIDFTVYTIVGNLPNTLYSPIADTYKFQNLIYPLFFFITIVYIFSVFRVKKRGL